MSERQQNINTKPSRLSQIAHNKLFQGAALTGIGTVTALAISGGKDAHADYHAPLIDRNDSHSQPVNNQNLDNQIEVGGVKYEVTGLPQFKTVLSSKIDAGYLASQLGDEITFTVPEGSNVNDQIHDQVLNKTGADLGGADTWKVVTEVGGAGDSLVFPEQVKTYKVNEDAVSTIQNADVEVTVPVTSSAETAETQQAAKGVVDAEIQAQNADENVAPSAEATGNTNQSDQSENIVDPTPTPGSVTQASAANSEATSVVCNPYDLKGNVLNFSESKSDDPNMVVDNRALFYFENVSNDLTHTCAETVIVRTFESPQLQPNGSGWLESQKEVVANRKEFLVPAGTVRKEWVDFTNTGGCTVQIDALKAGNGLTLDQVMELPADKLSGEVMVDFAFHENPDCIPTATATASPTVTFTPTPADTETPTPTPTNTQEAPTSTPTLKPSEFPNCETLTGPGDEAHYDTGTHWIVGDGLLEGKDDVYTVGNSNYTQCFCPPEEKNINGDEGIQTNFESANTETKPSARDGFYLVWGPDFGLKRSWYYASGADKPTPITPNFDCNPEKPTMTPTSTATNTATATATNTASPTVTFTSTAINTEVPKSTNTPKPTKTPMPANTKEVSTNTPIPPTKTPTRPETPPAKIVLPKTGSGPDNSKGKYNLPFIMAGIAALTTMAAAEAARRARASFNNISERPISLTPNADEDENYIPRVLALLKKAKGKIKKGNSQS